MFLFVVAMATTCDSAIYRNELRHLPEKRKQERIRETVNNTFTLVKDQVWQTALLNESTTNFTLFCIEPNSKKHLFRKNGAIYRLLDIDEPDYAYIAYRSQSDGSQSDAPRIHPKPKCSIHDGYELYNRFGYVQPYQSDHPYYVQQDYSAHSKHRVSVPQLEQNPTLYVQQFFYLFKQQFPDVSLTLSRERKGTGIFETDCCPIYIVSW